MRNPDLRGKFVRLVSYNHSEGENIPPIILNNCATVDVSNDGGIDEDYVSKIDVILCNIDIVISYIILQDEQIADMDNSIPKLKKPDIVKFKIIITTLSNAGQLMKMRFPDNHFDTIIIDEAGQASEPESYLPLTLLSKTGHVILAGDHLQLGPLAFSSFVKKAGLRQSLLERLINNECYSDRTQNNTLRPQLIAVLKKNYRSVPSILEVFNELFYKKELEATISSENSPEAHLLELLTMNVFQQEGLWTGPISNKCGVFFADVVKGRNTREKGRKKSHSWCNNSELNFIRVIINELRKVDSKVLKASDIGIVSLSNN